KPKRRSVSSPRNSATNSANIAVAPSCSSPSSHSSHSRIERVRLTDRRSSLCFFFDQSFAVRGLVRGDYLFGEFGRHVVVVGIFHRIAGSPLCHGGEIRGVGKHLS